MKGSDKNKAILLVVLIALVAAVAAWNLGIFRSGASKAVAPPANNSTAGTDDASKPVEEGGPASHRKAPN